MQEQDVAGRDSDSLAIFCPIPVKNVIGYTRQRLARNAGSGEEINMSDFSRTNPVHRRNSLTGLTTET